MTFPKSTLALAVMAATVSLAATPVAFAEALAEKENKAQSKPVLLNQVTVTATRTEKNHADVVQSIDVIDQAGIEQQQASSVPELMEYLPNVSVTGGPRGSAQGVNIRGLGGTRVLQVVDGARQDFSNGHRGTYFADPELLQSVEIVKGPSSSLWGSGAIGGVVVQNTKDAQDLLEDGQHLGGYVSQGYHSNNRRSLTSGAVYGMQGDVDWLLNGYYNDGENYELGNGQDLANSGSREQGGMAKLGWNVNNDSRLEFKAQHLLYNGLVPSNPATIEGTSSPLVERDSKSSNLSAAWLFDPESELINGKLQLFYNDTRYQEDRITKGQKDNTRYKTHGLALTNLSIVNSIELVYGLDAYQNKITTVRDTTGSTPDSRPEGLDGQSATMGSFLQGSVPLARDWTLQAGVRYDHFSAEDNRSNPDVTNKKQTDQAFSPSVGVIWSANEWLTLTASYNEAFRAPGMEEMFSTGTHFAMGPLKNVFVPNPDLQPEEAKNKELSARMAFAELLGEDELTLNANIFHNDVDNFINQFTYAPAFGSFGPPTKTSWENVEEAELKGFEIAGEYRIQNIETGLSYGQTRGEDKQSGEALGNIPADKIVADLAYLALQGDVKVGTRYTHVNDQNRVDPDNTVDQYEGYDLVDFYASYEPAAGSLKGLKADFTIKNAADKYYRVAWQELYQPGRSYRLDLRYMF
ncbi:TonB-dependent hemoglobin/transferrin/lactoferrin family receptor [Endozoicomonas sp. SESOKO1]|uniref:TonB-dependent hemoglobin/transferrin/lactoferrin family receptor n=1 Tax=Endozoicomonas sp. SESOKO1 TaxID=2828742 RepID=UPI0021496B75|nr:TonB-dependent hemoglobin/transferrin/lactoferrin family receptor [Endozoicomonas sp. SESOKO1]